MARIFVSYATSDRSTADEVSSWLREAGHETFVDHDLRGGIAVGEEWRERLYRELRAVDALVGVVTTSYVASSWCAAEVGIADALGCRLIPVRAEAGAVHPLMAGLQHAEYAVDVEEARVRILRASRELEYDGGRWKEGENPYPGLEPFTEARSRVFFGRATDTREVVKRLRTAQPGAALAIVGPSGCGKSSLLNAGVLPALDADHAWLTIVPMTPRVDPIGELARSLASAAVRLGLAWSAEGVRSKLEADADGLRRLADDLVAARPGARRRLVVPVDQAEELITRSGPAARARFADLLGRALGGPVQVVTVMRSEFLDDLVELPGLSGGQVEAYVLSPLHHDALRDVIERPARTARLCIEPELVSRLATDTGVGEALPLLAFTLHRMAEGLRPGDPLSLARYEDLGGVVNALTRHADDALAEAVRVACRRNGSVGGGLTVHDVLIGLTRLVTIDDAGRWARRAVEMARLDAELREAFQVFVDRRLLFTYADEDRQAWVTVTHEALFTQWQPLASAIADSATALRTVQAVRNAAAEWIRDNKSEHHLWDEERLAAIRAALGGRGREPAMALEGPSAAFLAACTEHVQRVRERDRRRRARTIVALSALLVVALVGGVVALVQQQRAKAGQDLAIARSMVAQADRIRNSDPRAALQLGVAALAFDTGSQTQASLRQTLTSTHRFTTLRGHERAVYGVAISGDGRLLATSSGDSSVRLWDMSDPHAPRQLGAPLVDGVEAVNDVAFSPDGSILAAAHGDKKIRLWDIRDPEHARLIGGPLEGHADWVYEVAFTPDGRTLVSSGKDGTAILWDVADPEHPRRLGDPLDDRTGPVEAVLSPTGSVLAIAAQSGTVTLWDVADREHPRPLGGPIQGGANGAAAFSADGRVLANANGDNTITLWDVGDPGKPSVLAAPFGGMGGASVLSVAFSPDGRVLASTHGDGTIRLWDVADRSAPWQLGQTLTGHTGTAVDVAFSPDGRTLATSSLDQTAIVWDLTDQSVGGQLGRPVTGSADAVWGASFLPDQHTLVTAGSDRMIRLWNLADHTRPELAGPVDTGQTDGVVDTSLSADGRLLITAGRDRSARLWDLSDPHAVRPLGPPLVGQEEPVYTVAVSPDGRLAAVSGGADQRVALWDLSDRERPRQIDQLLATGHIQTVNDLAFSPDGHVLATASQDQTIRLWDVRDPAAPRQLGRHLQGHTDSVLAVAFSPDGRTLASAGDDLTVRLWDVTNPEQARLRGQPLTGHSRSINALAFSPDGRVLASASADQSVVLWDVRDPDLVIPLGRPLTGHTDAVYTVAFSADGRTLASAGADRTVILWNVPTLDDDPVGRVREACRRAGNPLDASTWSRYAPGVGYRDTCA